MIRRGNTSSSRTTGASHRSPAAAIAAEVSSCPVASIRVAGSGRESSSTESAAPRTKSLHAGHEHQQGRDEDARQDVGQRKAYEACAQVAPSARTDSRSDHGTSRKTVTHSQIDSGRVITSAGGPEDIRVRSGPDAMTWSVIGPASASTGSSSDATTKPYTTRGRGPAAAPVRMQRRSPAASRWRWRCRRRRPEVSAASWRILRVQRTVERIPRDVLRPHRARRRALGRRRDGEGPQQRHQGERGEQLDADDSDQIDIGRRVSANRMPAALVAIRTTASASQSHRRRRDPEDAVVGDGEPEHEGDAGRPEARTDGGSHTTLLTREQRDHDAHQPHDGQQDHRHRGPEAQLQRRERGVPDQQRCRTDGGSRLVDQQRALEDAERVERPIGRRHRDRRSHRGQDDPAGPLPGGGAVGGRAASTARHPQQPGQQDQRGDAGAAPELADGDADQRPNGPAVTEPGTTRRRTRS